MRCVSVCLSVRLSVWLSACLSVCLFSVCLSVLSVCLFFVCLLSVYLSVCWCVCKATEQVKEAGGLHSQDYSAWRTHSGKLRAAHNIPPTAKPWTTRRGIALDGVASTLRVHDVLDVFWGVVVNRAPKTMSVSEVRSGLWCDVSQAVQRQNHNPRSVPGMTTRSMYYSFEFDKTISAKGNLQMLGHPATRMSRERFSENQLRELAGEGFSIPCCSIVSFLMFANPFGEWW